jgi:hypothetical protein
VPFVGVEIIFYNQPNNSSSKVLLAGLIPATFFIQKQEMTMSSQPSIDCACPDCSCVIDEHQRYERNGEVFCSDACADLHPHGKPCPSPDCRCDSGARVDERHVTEANVDEALDETFPASDPISP